MPTHYNSISCDDPAVLGRVLPKDTRKLAPRSESRLRSPQTSVPLDEIWGSYNNYRTNGVAISAIIHAALIALLVSGALFGRQIVQQIVPQRPTVTLIAPSPDSYTLSVAKKVVSGGGGGGDHDKLPAPKGRLPKVAPQQITPPAIVVHNEHPRLAVEPTVVAPPQVNVADNHVPTLGVASAPVMPSAPPSNGTGSGGGIGSGSGGGVGVGHGPGVGPGTGGGIGGGVYKVGGGILAPQALATLTRNTRRKPVTLKRREHAFFN